MGVERQRDRAIRHFFGDEKIAAAMAALEIMPLQMQWIAVGRGFHLLEPQILHDGVAAGTGEAGPEMDHIEKPVYLGDVGADVRRLDALKGLHVFVIEMLDQPPALENFIQPPRLASPNCGGWMKFSSAG